MRDMGRHACTVNAEALSEDSCRLLSFLVLCGPRHIFHGSVDALDDLNSSTIHISLNQPSIPRSKAT
jgi:hypothetical protein